MSTSSPFEILPQKTCIPTTDEEWNTLTFVLYAYVKRSIYSLDILCWQGNEHFLAEDVVTEAIARALSYAKDAELGNHPPIDSFEAFCKTTAKRFLLDQRRKDRRLIASLDVAIAANTDFANALYSDPEATIIDEITQDEMLLHIAHIIDTFSPKMREAILIHIARNADFDDENPCPLERAMAAVGIPLRTYKRPLPSSQVLRSRHNAQVCLAIKRLRLELCGDLHLHELDNAA